MNRWKLMIGLTWAICPVLSGIATAQENTSASLAQTAPGEVVPAVVRYTGTLPGHPQERVPVRFSIYADASSRSALWTEDQNITPDKDGEYAILLGSASSIGLPPTLFSDGQARWLGIQVSGGEEQRSLLASVPFAMKAGDAETVAGHPITELVTQDQLRGAVAAQFAAQQLTSRQITPETTTPTSPTGSGSLNYLPLWTSPTTLGNSVMTQVGTGATGKIGIGTAAPSNTLDVYGGVTVRGDVVMEPTTVATASAPVNSPPFYFSASSWSSSLAKTVSQQFAFLTIVSGNNTANPSASLQLWHGSGTSAATPTGLSIAPTGIITFASGQTFPGAGSGGSTTAVNASSYDLGGVLFDSGSANNESAFLGFAGNGAANPPNYTTAAGSESMAGLTTGPGNTAFGNGSLYYVTTGNYNTAVGTDSGGSTTTGVYNTSLGAFAGPNGPGIGEATAIGYTASVSQDASLVLGSTVAGEPGATWVNVGIGTSSPTTTMEIAVDSPNTLGPTLLLSNTGGTTKSGEASAASIDFKTYLHTSTAVSPTSRIEAVDNDYGNNLVFQAKIPGADNNPLVNVMSLTSGSGGYVTIDNPIIVDYYNGVPDGANAAEFGGNITVDGTVSSDQAQFRIDHPSDPANKYLQHASVQSSEMMNIYSGNVTTDELGQATVQLPDWFEAENGNFRYQLTTIGRDAHAWIAAKVANHQFKIATNATFVEVSWQITGVRQDAYAKAHPLVVEQEKPALERGSYIHPELYGQPASKRTIRAAHPKQFQERKPQPEISAVTAPRKRPALRK